MPDSRRLPPNRRVRPTAVQPPAVVEAPGEEYAAARPTRDRKPSPSPAVKSRLNGRGLLRRIQPVMGLLVVVSTSIAVAWGIRHHVMTSPRFAVRTIRVEGTSHRNSEQLAAVAGLQIGKNIFSIDLESAQLRMLQDPWIENAIVRRKLPSTILVEVAEREAAAAIAIGPEVYLCTPDGELFKKIEPADAAKRVVITGITTQQVAQDRAGTIRRIRAALDLAADYEQRGPARRLPLEEINLAEDGAMRMVVGKEAVLLELGQAPYRQKVLRVARVLEEVERRHAQPSLVFLDNEAHPERVVVRMR